jgi:hypothetical protein
LDFGTPGDTVSGAPKPIAANLHNFVPGIGRIYREGERNDTLFRRACGLRRKNFSREQIERALANLNRQCQPPLDAKELRKIAESTMRYPTGGPDQLATAWSKVNGKHRSRYARFVALAGELQAIREGLSVALPVARVSELLDCTHQLTSRYRHRAEREGVLTLAERHSWSMRRATTYRVDLDRVRASLFGTSLMQHPDRSSLMQQELDRSNATPLSNAPVAISLSSDLMQHLLKLTDRGWQLFPCKPRDKAPAITSWPERATSDPESLARWMQEFPDANWAVVCGERSGVWALDIDGDEGTFSSLKMIRENGGKKFQAINTLASRTAAGWHMYFRWPADGGIRNSAGRLAPGCDVRGEGGYVIVPPSIHPNGKRYEWISEGAEIAEAPAWLMAMLIEHKLAMPVDRGVEFAFGWNLAEERVCS